MFSNDTESRSHQESREGVLIVITVFVFLILNLFSLNFDCNHVANSDWNSGLCVYILGQGGRCVGWRRCDRTVLSQFSCNRLDMRSLIVYLFIFRLGR